MKTYPIVSNNKDLVQASKAIRDVLSLHFSKKLEEFEDHLEESKSTFSSSILETVKASFQKEIESFKESLRAEMKDAIREAYQASLSALKEFILSIERPDIVVNLPEYKSPDVIVNNPTFNLPEAPLSKVDIHVPPPRRFKKQITYDGNGRPIEIEEVEVG